MAGCVVQAEAVSKKFRIGQHADYSRLSEALQHWLTPWRRARGAQQNHSEAAGSGREFWALKDISFEVQPGEILGIIGRNGAGKSTLLKILTRITRPTSGRIGTRGRVGSLLEVGTGFHPELTGRENIFLNGSILGMSRREILSKFDEIVAFAEVEQFIDTPVKRYSSGMYTRLAFSVAAHLEPEILIVDEVLAVGDAAFQKKCLGKMRDVARHGRTILFVSHNMSAIKSLCTHGLYLDRGKCQQQGDVQVVIEAYHAANNNYRAAQQQWTPEDAPGNSSLRILAVQVAPLTGNEICISSGLSFEIQLLVDRTNTEIECILQIETLEAVLVFYQGVLLAEPEDLQPGTFQVTAQVPAYLLNRGHYRLQLLFGENTNQLLFRLDDALEFEVSNDGAPSGATPKPGIIAPKIVWNVQRNEPARRATTKGL